MLRACHSARAACAPHSARAQRALLPSASSSSLLPHPPAPRPGPRPPQIAFIAGCLYTAVGLFRMGWLTNFLSSAVISGFMTGASVIIALSQVGG